VGGCWWSATRDHWLDFTPELTTSPTSRDALIAQLPTWVWDRNTADVRGICRPIYGGVCGFAVRLGTTWRTEGSTFCRGRGTPYRPGQSDPLSASDCSWTYRTSGDYDIRGCKNWLVVVWRLPWYPDRVPAGALPHRPGRRPGGADPLGPAQVENG
jgi:hypothetical protein